MVGDRDGVVVVAQDRLDDVHEQLLAVRAAESSYPKDSDGRVHVPEYVRDLLASEQVATSADGIIRDLVQQPQRPSRTGTSACGLSCRRRPPSPR